MEKTTKMMDEALIRYKNVYINQQELGVLEDVNLELNKGEFVTSLGKSVPERPHYWKQFTVSWIYSQEKPRC